MKPYCGWIKARKRVGPQTCRTKGPCPSWHRPAGIKKIEMLATRRALKKAERQQAQKEIRKKMETSNNLNETNASVNDISALTPEQRIRAAKSPEEVALALIGLAGEGLGLGQIIDAMVDAKIDDAQLPDGTNRTQVKKGITKIFGSLRVFLR